MLGVFGGFRAENQSGMPSVIYDAALHHFIEFNFLPSQISIYIKGHVRKNQCENNHSDIDIKRPAIPYHLLVFLFGHETSSKKYLRFFHSLRCFRACLKITFRQMCVTVCRKLEPNEGGVEGGVDRMRAKFPA